MQRPNRYVGAVRHDAIDAEMNEPLHLGRIVNRPHVDFDPTMVRKFDKTRRHHANSALTFGYLESIYTRKNLPRCAW